MRLADVWPFIASAFTAVLAGAVTAVTRRPKDHADVARTLTDSALQIVNELQEELAQVRAELKIQRVETERCEVRYQRLVYTLRAQGIAVPEEA